MPTELTHGSIFSGIGGFDLAFDRCGVKTIWQVEKDAAARSVLAYHWPNVPRFDDVCTVGKHNLEYVDILSGGFPCQNLSVAGKREGLTGVQSGLYWEMVRIIDEIQPRIVLWENVPGLLSSDKGRDFGRVLAGMADIGYVGSYRILNAQYFGVAQRRRRVFGVFARGDIGADCCRQILALTESLSRYPASGREKRKDVAGPIGQRINRSHTELDGHGAYIPLTAPCLTSNYGKQPDNSDTSAGPMLVPLTARCITTGEGARIDAESCTFIPMVYDTTQVTSKTNRSNPQAGAPSHPLAAGAQPPLLVPAPVFTLQHAQINRKDEAGPQGKGWQQDIAFTMDNLSEADAVAYGIYDEQTPKIGENIMPTLRSRKTGGGNMQSVVTPYAVRRLTPRECERLQGYDDDWTLITASSKQQTDSPRYRQLGNSVAVPCVEWIARRIVKELDSQ